MQLLNYCCQNNCKIWSTLQETFKRQGNIVQRSTTCGVTVTTALVSKLNEVLTMLICVFTCLTCIFHASTQESTMFPLHLVLLQLTCNNVNASQPQSSIWISRWRHCVLVQYYILQYWATLNHHNVIFFAVGSLFEMFYLYFFRHISQSFLLINVSSQECLLINLVRWLGASSTMLKQPTTTYAGEKWLSTIIYVLILRSRDPHQIPHLY